MARRSGFYSERKQGMIPPAKTAARYAPGSLGRNTARRIQKLD